MIKQIFDTKPEAIQKLGTGYYNIHLNIEEVQVEQINEETEESEIVTKWQCNVIRVHDASYSTIVNELIRREYTIDDELALHRQREVKTEEFQEYFDYCEECKSIIREALSHENNTKR